jgi:hypothetical protein
MDSGACSLSGFMPATVFQAQNPVEQTFDLKPTPQNFNAKA